MSKNVIVKIELSPRDLQAVIKIAQEIDRKWSEPKEAEVLDLLEKIGAAFEKAAGKKV